MLPESSEHSLLYVIHHDFLYFFDGDSFFITEPPSNQRHHIGSKQSGIEISVQVRRTDLILSAEFIQNIIVDNLYHFAEYTVFRGNGPQNPVFFLVLVNKPQSFFKVTIPIFLDFILIISFTVDCVTAERVASLFTVMFLSLHSCNMRLETASETDLHTIIIIPFSNDDTTNFR